MNSEWAVVFCDGDARGQKGLKALFIGFVLHLLKGGFKHCLLIKATASGFIWLEYTLFNLFLGSYSLDEVLNLLERREYTVIYHNAVMPDSVRLPNMFTCVGLAKQVLGIRAWCVITPWQLYKHLTKEKKHGG